jgi:hypothetical protein
MSIEKDKGQCETCGKEFAYFLIHNGFNDSAYSYCNSCGRTSILSGWYDKIPAVAKLKLHQAIPETTEPYLEKCECGGDFKRDASPRCPYCNTELSAIAATTHIEKNSPGTQKGWRWQQNWQGIYCVIVEGKSVTNNWKNQENK